MKNLNKEEKIEEKYFDRRGYVTDYSHAVKIIRWHYDKKYNLIKKVSISLPESHEEQERLTAGKNHCRK